MFNVIPLHPVRRAFEELQQIGRTDLRAMTAKVVVEEVRKGRDGLSVQHQLQAHRLQTQASDAAGAK